LFTLTELRVSEPVEGFATDDKIGHPAISLGGGPTSKRESWWHHGIGRNNATAHGTRAREQPQQPSAQVPLKPGSSR
jgi:hypothetical protein